MLPVCSVGSSCPSCGSAVVSGLRVADVNFLRGVVHPAQQWPDKPLIRDHVHRAPFAGARLVRSAGQPQRMGDPVEVHFRYFPSPSLLTKDVRFGLSVHESSSSRSV